MSSLLMQAARAAAQEDGVLVDAQQQQQAPTSTSAAEALQQARNALAIQVSVNNAVQQQQQQQQQQQMKINAATVAAAAAQAQGAATPTTGKKKGPPLRRGKWTPEEEAYAARLIHEFKAGLLPLTDGTTLRTFLSKLLNCDPMRISKKFVGSNCIGKQVFRRRTADLNRLTPEQIQQSRIELSDLERRFLERVAQTNRVKNNGCTGTGGAPPNNVPQHPQASLATSSNVRGGTNGLVGGFQKHAAMSSNNSNHGDNNGYTQQNNMNYPNMNNGNNININPPWLQPPMGYRHGSGQAFAQSHLNSHTKARAAAAGRALLGSSFVSTLQQQPQQHHQHQQQQQQQQSPNSSANKLQSLTTDQLASFVRTGGSAGLLALTELQRRSSQLQTVLQQQQNESVGNNDAKSLLAAAVQSSSTSALQELVRNASAHHLANQLGNGDLSMNSLLLKTGLSRDQLSQLARDRGLGSTNSLGNLMNQQKSFDALMSLDFQSLQSIDNLANLIQSGGVAGLNMPISNMKNADFDAILSAASSRNNLIASSTNASDSNQDFSNAAQQLADAASSNRVNALLRNLSNNNVPCSGPISGDTSNATLSNLLQSMQANNNQFNGQGNTSATSLLNQMGMDGNTNTSNSTSQSAMNLARFLRPESSTGLSALRMQDGLNQRNSSSVDDFLSLIAAGDIPHQDASLLNVPLMQQQDAAAKLLAQQHLLAASQSFSNMQRANNVSEGSSSSGLDDTSFQGNSAALSNSASAVAMAMAQVRASMQSNANNNKRHNDFISGNIERQDEAKR